jgi:hypothetical protein
MIALIKSLMSPAPKSRPTAAELLTLHDVIIAGNTCDESLLGAKPKIPHPPVLARTASFIPLEYAQQQQQQQVSISKVRSNGGLAIINSADADTAGEQLRSRMMTPTNDLLGSLW